MNRQEFYAKLSKLDDEHVRKALWTLYWRGSAQFRERIEGELEPARQAAMKRAASRPPDPEAVLHEVHDFAELVRAGAYMAGDRRVSPKERTRWRVTFRRLAADALSALRDDDPGPAEEAVALMVDLACETARFDYFRSEDPMEAARFVVSDAVALLWESVLERRGFREFARLATRQLPRWESRYGWTRTGWGKLREQETSLASVLARMLRAPDMWTTFADCYLGALDEIARVEAAGRKSVRTFGYDSQRYARTDRTANLAQWHSLLQERLAGSDAEDRLDRLASHSALGGPELTFLQASLARQRGDIDMARKLTQDCLHDLPGHKGFAAFAAEVGAEVS